MQCINTIKTWYTKMTFENALVLLKLKLFSICKFRNTYVNLITLVNQNSFNVNIKNLLVYFLLPFFIPDLFMYFIRSDMWVRYPIGQNSLTSTLKKIFHAFMCCHIFYTNWGLLCYSYIKQYLTFLVFRELILCRYGIF
jgi:hypothetical protein